MMASFAYGDMIAIICRHNANKTFVGIYLENRKRSPSIMPTGRCWCSLRSCVVPSGLVWVCRDDGKATRRLQTIFVHICLYIRKELILKGYWYPRGLTLYTCLVTLAIINVAII